MANIKKPISRVQQSALQRKFGTQYKTRDQVEVAIRKLVKQRNQILLRYKAAKEKRLKEQGKPLVEKAEVKSSKRFDPYGVYYFTYKHPVTNPPIWDIKPLAIMLGMQAGVHGRMLLAVNLHWIPRHYRYVFWKYITTTYEDLKSRGKEKELPLIVYKEIKKIRQLKPAMQAIRKYYLNRIGGVVRVPEENYDKIFVKYRSLKKIVRQQSSGILNRS